MGGVGRAAGSVGVCAAATSDGWGIALTRRLARTQALRATAITRRRGQGGLLRLSCPFAWELMPVFEPLLDLKCLFFALPSQSACFFGARPPRRRAVGLA
jgi:hypothetical protein